MLCLLALALLAGAVPARALLVSVEVMWGYPSGISSDTLLNNPYHLQVGSIIQFIAFDSTTAATEHTQTGENAAKDNFLRYGDSYLPDTTVGGHQIVGTGTVQLLSGSTNSGVFGITTWLDVPYPYDRLYVRVFSATNFDQGNATTSWWGISSASNLTGGAFGTTLTWFDNTELPNQNTFEVIPEPSSLSFLLSGGCGLGVFAFHRRRRSLRPPEE